MLNFLHVRFLAIAVCCLSFPASVYADPLTLVGTITGTINGQTINATTTGTIDPAGGGGSATIVFSSTPAGFHPAALSWSLISLACGNGLTQVNGGMNLFTLTGGNYTATRTVFYPTLPGSSLQTVGTVSTSNGVMTYNLSVSGNYAGPTDLTGVTDYHALWTPSGAEIFETGGATINRAGGLTFPDIWTTTYSTGGTVFTVQQVVSINFTTQDFDGTTLNLAFNGTVEPVPEPTTLLLLGTGLAGVAIKTRKTLKGRKSE